MTPPPAPLHLPEDLRYGCVRCGRSCTDFDLVEVDAAAADQIRRLPLFNPRLESSPGRAGELPYAEAPELASGLALRRAPRAGGGERCVMLDRDHLCALHAAHGAEAKPAACRAFPFRAVETPGGTYVAVSFACTAVLLASGPPLRGRDDEVRGALAAAPGVRDVWEPVILTAGRELTWREYLSLEADLVSILHAAPTAAAALETQAAHIRAAAGDGDHAPPVASGARRAALRARARSLAFATIGVGGSPLPILRHPSLEDRVDDPGSGPPLPDAPHPDALLRRFIEHRLFRKDLLRAHSVAFVHHLMLVEHALIHLYAAALAQRRGRNAPAPGDVVEAVRLVEEQFVAHASFVDRAATEYEGEWQELFRAPDFAGAMAHASGSDTAIRIMS